MWGRFLRLTSWSSGNGRGYRKIHSEKKEEATDDRPMELVTILVEGKRRKRYDLPMEIVTSSTFKGFLREYEDEIVLKKKNPDGLPCSSDEFENMLNLARAEINGRYY